MDRFPTEQISNAVSHGIAKATDAAQRAVQLIASASQSADALFGGGAVQQAIQAHVGAKLGAAAASSLTSGAALIGAAGVIYVAVKAAAKVQASKSRTAIENDSTESLEMTVKWALADMLADCGPSVHAAFAAAGYGMSTAADSHLRPFLAPLPRAVLAGQHASGATTLVSGKCSCSCGRMQVAVSLRAAAPGGYRDDESWAHGAGTRAQTGGILHAHASPALFGGRPFISAPASCVKVTLTKRSLDGRDVHIGAPVTTAVEEGQERGTAFRPMECTLCGQAPVLVLEAQAGSTIGPAAAYAIDACRVHSWHCDSISVTHPVPSSPVLAVVVHGWDGYRLDSGGSLDLQSGRAVGWPASPTGQPTGLPAAWAPTGLPAHQSLPRPGGANGSGHNGSGQGDGQHSRSFAAAPRSPGTAAAAALRAMRVPAPLPARGGAAAQQPQQRRHEEQTGQGRTRSEPPVLGTAAAALPLALPVPAPVPATGLESAETGCGARQWPFRGVYRQPSGPITVTIDIRGPVNGRSSRLHSGQSTSSSAAYSSALSLSERVPLRASSKGPQARIVVEPPSLTFGNRRAEALAALSAAGAPAGSLHASTGRQERAIDGVGGGGGRVPASHIPPSTVCQAGGA